MDILGRITELLKEFDWSVYRLSKASGIPPSTLSNMFKKSTCPTVPTLQAICKGFGITLSEFFEPIEDKSIEEKEIDELIRSWKNLDAEQRWAYKILMNISSRSS